MPQRIVPQFLFWAVLLPLLLVGLGGRFAASALAQEETPVQLDLAALPAAFADPLSTLLEPVGDEGGGLLLVANEQSKIAVAHTVFLQNSLTADDLPEVRRHAEDIINILDGENGVLFGDLDRDGQLQNSGDGTGVHVYLDDSLTAALEIASALETSARETSALEASGVERSDDDARDLLLAVGQTTEALNTAGDGVTLAYNFALQILAADTVAEAQPFADELTILIADLQANIESTLSAAFALHDAVVESPVVESLVVESPVVESPSAASAEAQSDVPLTQTFANTTLIRSSRQISATVAQSSIAVQHTGFLQNSLGESDLPEARRHTEHIINTLDGESGIFYGDLDRDGQAQNPGDGTGVRVYLEDVTTLVETISSNAGSATGAVIDPESVQEILDVLATSRELLADATTVAVKVFAADTITEMQPFGDQLTQEVAALSAQNLIAQTLIDELVSSLRPPPVSAFDATARDAAQQALTSATEQSAIAVQHTGFLQNSLGESDLPEARRHTEHIVNILDGESGNLYGDLDRDGQSQNPGDGNGVRVYFERVQPFVESNAAMGSDEDTDEGTDEDDELATAVTDGQTAVDDALVLALKIFASDTVTETQTFSDQLTQEVATINQQSSTALATIETLLSETAAPSAAPPLGRTAVGTPALRKMLESLETVGEQSAIAVEHTGFLQNSLTESDLPEARRHTEHIVNILDGEAGILYGDLDRDGQSQNPGDGNGVRVYIEDATGQATSILDALDTNASTEQLSLVAQSVVDSLDAANALVPRAYEQALLLFASDSITEALVYAEELTEHVAGINGLLSDATSSSAELQQTNIAAPQGQSVPRPAVRPPQAAAAGDIWQNPADNANYVFVPAGGFTIGTIDAVNGAANERPAHTVILEAFWIAQTETTNAQYKQCVDAGRCTPPNNERWNSPAYAAHPVTHVNWTQANTYARWAGGRLPTEAEWGKSCKGQTLREYPWGNELPTTELANVNSSTGDTTEVGSYAAGESPFGLLDMGGNVQEWTINLVQAYPYIADDGRESLDTTGSRTVRGGAYSQPAFQQRCSARTSTEPNRADELLGLRIVLSYGQE